MRPFCVNYVYYNTDGTINYFEYNYESGYSQFYYDNGYFYTYDDEKTTSHSTSSSMYSSQVQYTEDEAVAKLAALKVDL